MRWYLHVVASLEVMEEGTLLPVDVTIEGNGYAVLSVMPLGFGEHKLSIKVKNRHIFGSPYNICSRSTAMLKNIDSSKKQLFDVGNSSMDVAVDHDEDVYVSNYRDCCVQVFNSDGTRKLRIGSKGSMQRRSA